MQHATLNYKDEIVRELKDLTASKAKEVLDFICFVKHKEALSKIDPTQAYFFTPKWQKLEKEADEDIKAGPGSGEISALLILLLIGGLVGQEFTNISEQKAIYEELQYLIEARKNGEVRGAGTAQ